MLIFRFFGPFPRGCYNLHLQSQWRSLFVVSIPGCRRSSSRLRMKSNTSSVTNRACRTKSTCRWWNFKKASWPKQKRWRRSDSRWVELRDGTFLPPSRSDVVPLNKAGLTLMLRELDDEPPAAGDAENAAPAGDGGSGQGDVSPAGRGQRLYSYIIFMMTFDLIILWMLNMLHSSFLESGSTWNIQARYEFRCFFF